MRDITKVHLLGIAHTEKVLPFERKLEHFFLMENLSLEFNFADFYFAQIAPKLVLQNISSFTVYFLIFHGQNKFHRSNSHLEWLKSESMNLVLTHMNLGITNELVLWAPGHAKKMYQSMQWVMSVNKKLLHVPSGSDYIIYMFCHQ